MKKKRLKMCGLSKKARRGVEEALEWLSIMRFCAVFDVVLGVIFFMLGTWFWGAKLIIPPADPDIYLM
jgi:hypothetical protein